MVGKYSTVVNFANNMVTSSSPVMMSTNVSAVPLAMFLIAGMRSWHCGGVFLSTWSEFYFSSPRLWTSPNRDHTPANYSDRWHWLWLWWYPNFHLSDHKFHDCIFNAITWHCLPLYTWSPPLSECSQTPICWSSPPLWTWWWGWWRQSGLLLIKPKPVYNAPA